MPFAEETHGRILAKLVRELLRRETFACLADLTEALKRRCGPLRIRWTNDDITDAFRLVGSNAALCELPPAIVTHYAEEPDGPPPLSQEETLAFLIELKARLGLAPVVKTMPAVRPLSSQELLARQFRIDQQRAMAIVEQEMVESLRRCAALEQAIREDAPVAIAGDRR